MAKPTVPTKAQGDKFLATECNNIVDSIDAAYDEIAAIEVGGYVDRTFNAAIVFDAPFKSVFTQTGDITLSLSGTPTADVTGRITIVGDGVHALIFPAFDPTFGAINWFNASGQVFDNTSENDIYFEFDGRKILFTIVPTPTPDVTAPSLLSAIIANATPTQITLSYSELLDATSVPATGDFSADLGKAVTAVTISGSIVTVTVDTPYVNGDSPQLSYTPGGNPIQDPSHNHSVALVNQAVTNDVLAASTSMYITSSTQLPKTSIIPSNFAFGSGGTDVPFSISFWIKWGTSDGPLLVIGPASGSSYGLTAQLVGGAVYFQLFGSSGSSAQIYINSNSAIVTNTWTHVVLTYDGTKATSGMKIYFDGTLAATSSGSSGAYDGQHTFAAGTLLSLLGDPDGTGSFFNTRLSSLYIWNKELTSGDVTAIENGGSLVDPTTLAIASHLIGQYDLNGDLTDKGPSHYDLTSSVSPTFVADIP